MSAAHKANGAVSPACGKEAALTSAAAQKEVALGGVAQVAAGARAGNSVLDAKTGYGQQPVVMTAASAGRCPKILFFDSGMGGLSVFTEVRKLNPDCAYYYLFDHEVFPYGEKSEAFLVARVTTLLNKVSACLAPDLIVIACNTASTVVLDQIRPSFPIPIVGVVPAIKPAGELSRKRKIALLATPGTVQRAYTQRLIANFAADCEVLRIGTVALVHLAENCLLSEVSSYQHSHQGSSWEEHTVATIGSGLQLNVAQEQELRQILAPVTSLPSAQQPDVLILGCTHFPLLKDHIAEIVGPQIALVDSGAAIGRRVHTVLAQQLKERLAQGSPNDRPVQAGAWTAWYTGQVSALEHEQFAATFAYFGFHQVQALTL